MAEIREVWGEKNMPNLTTFSGDLLRTKEGRVIFIETADGNDILSTESKILLNGPITGAPLISVEKHILMMDPSSPK